MPHFLPIAGAALALLPCAAWAQAPPDTAAPLRLALQDAMTRAQKYSQQTFNANIEALLAREDTKQAKAALLPTVNGFSQYIYTQANGAPSGTFVPNDGVHVYNDYVTAHADLYAPAKRADYHLSLIHISLPTAGAAFHCDAANTVNGVENASNVNRLACISPFD